MSLDCWGHCDDSAMSAARTGQSIRRARPSGIWHNYPNMARTRNPQSSGEPGTFADEPVAVLVFMNAAFVARLRGVNWFAALAAEDV